MDGGRDRETERRKGMVPTSSNEEVARERNTGVEEGIQTEEVSSAYMAVRTSSSPKNP